MFCSGHSGKSEVPHFQRGPLSFSVPPAIREGPIRCWCECHICLQQATVVNYFAHMLYHLVVYNRFCRIPPTIPVHFCEFGRTGTLFGTGTPFPCISRHLTTDVPLLRMQDYSALPAGSAAVMAHEMGHNFGFEHDDDIGPCTCHDPTGNCIMYSRTRSVTSR